MLKCDFNKVAKQPLYNVCICMEVIPTVFVTKPNT